MTTLSSVAGALGRGGFNVAVNAGTAYLFDVVTWYDPTSNREVAIIVAIDTAFRIGITHVLDALENPVSRKRNCRPPAISLFGTFDAAVKRQDRTTIYHYRSFLEQKRTLC